MLSRCSYRLVGAAIVAAGLFAATDVAAQEPGAYTIQGTVHDAVTEQPLGDVAVVIRGTSRGTLTDGDGRYTLLAPLSAGTYTLEFSTLGRGTVTRAVELGDSRRVQVGPVALEQSAVGLDEIVVTGSGVAAERRMVGNAVESVSSDAIDDAPGAGAIDVALQGKIPGAVISQNSGQPGGGVSIRLRGTSSITGGAEPLYVIDGVLVDNSSIALVSMSANAGRGSASMTNRLADLSPSDIERVEVLKGAAAAALYGSRANNGVIQIFTKSGQQGEPRIRYRSEFSLSRTPARYDLVDIDRAGFADMIWGGADSVGAQVDRNDLQDKVWQDGRGITQQVSISGGNESTTYYVSGSYLDETGILRTSGRSKASGRIKLTQQVSDRFEITANGNVVQSESNFVPEGEQTEGVLTSLIFTPTSWDPTKNEETGQYPNNPVLRSGNPLDVLENWEMPENVLRFIGSFEATFRPTDDLTLRYLAGVDDYRQENRYYRPAGSTSPDDRGTVQNPIRLSRQINQDVTANHLAGLSPSLTLNTTAGFRYTADRANHIRAAATDLAPGQTLVGGATQFASQSLSEFRTIGGFIQERLSIGDRLFLTGGLNTEASSAFGAEERWQFFPRLSASYMLSDEPFWAEMPAGDIVSTLRLRAAFGETGGQPPGAYLRQNNYGDVAYGGRSGFVASSTIGNPNLRPERQREYEGGIEAGLFDDRVMFEFTYYDRKTSDLVLSVPLPPSTGAQRQYQNIGAIHSRGVETSLETVNMNRPEFTWRSRLSVSSNDDRVTQLVTDADTLTYGYLNTVIEGQPVGVFYGGYYARNEDGSIAHDENGIALRATNEDGDAAKKILGDPNPDFTAALGNEFDIGDNLSVSVLLDGRFGNDVANFTRRITEFFGVDAAVEREITGDTVPRTYTLNPNGRIQIYEEYIEDGSFVKLRELSLRYRLDQAWVQNLGARSIDLRVAGRNLYTWTDYSGLDPEINLFAANTVARGVDFANTPIARQVVFGLDFNF